ncbi:MAG: flagellar biosynthetic protein FliR [Bdellovibrionales bacterium]|nr:flagellar biosynthetic protein FliR [Bdellovibrionales bacterium]
MENIYQFSEPKILSFCLVMLRLSGFVVTWPFFSGETVPSQIKILFALLTSILIFPNIEWHGLQNVLNNQYLIFLSIKEVLIGLFFGYLGKMFISACQVAGDLVSVSVGLSGAQLFNPAMGSSSTPLDQLLFFLTGLCFLSINGHHLFLMGIVDTFRLIPLSAKGISLQPFFTVGNLVQEIVLIGLKMSAPILLSILVVNITMGLLGKVVPQINILVTSLSVNILLGFVVLILSLPFMMDEVPVLLEISARHIFQFMKGL